MGSSFHLLTVNVLGAVTWNVGFVYFGRCTFPVKVPGAYYMDQHKKTDENKQTEEEEPTREEIASQE